MSVFIDKDAKQWCERNAGNPIYQKCSPIVSFADESERDANNCVNDCENNFKHGCSFYFLANIVIIL
jgi:hypothetical protein